MPRRRDRPNSNEAYDPSRFALTEANITRGGNMRDFFVSVYVRLSRTDRGQTMAEYAVVLAVIAIGIFVALGALSGSINGALGKITSDL
jgi:Flp pilus assembly pilin Flp